MALLPLVAIVGRPNVGKSTLFNRIIGERRALVDDVPGVTRDRHYGEAEHRGRSFSVVDTGGYEAGPTERLLELVREQTMHAIAEAERIIFVTDVSQPDDPVDWEILNKLRKSGRSFVLAVNKCENHQLVSQAYGDFSRYGMEEVFPVSALHGHGVYELLDAATEGFRKGYGDDEDEPAGPIRVAIVGRTNVGKSTLVNRILGEERMIASPVAGTTRDAIDTPFSSDGQDFMLIDTAGIRRRSKTEKGPETLSVLASLRAIERAEVALLVVDVGEGLTDQDAHIAGYILERRRAAVIVLNKWDKIEKDNKTFGEWIRRTREHFKFMKWAPIITISGATGQRVSKLWPLVARCSEQFRREFSTRELNLALKRSIAHVSPPVVSGRPLRINYVTQTGHRPPAFSFFVNEPELMHFSYERYLENQFRQQLGFDSTPVIFRYKKKNRPIEERREREAAERPTRRRRRLLAADEDYQAPAMNEDGDEMEFIETGEGDDE